jgi:glutaredoxin-related protein
LLAKGGVHTQKRQSGKAEAEQTLYIEDFQDFTEAIDWLMAEYNGYSTVPMVFIEGEFAGGSEAAALI